MKKLRIILFIVLSSFTLHANSFESQNIQQKGCEEVLGAALFNGVLEDVCGFDGNVKERLKKIYDKNQCRNKVPQNKVDAIIQDNLEDSKVRYDAFGEKKFCEANMKPYVDLMRYLKHQER